jgi:hypothetical protein
MAAFQFDLQSGKRKVGWVVDDSLVIFCLKFLGENDAAAISFVARVRGEVFAHFHSVAVKATAVCVIDCLACQDTLFVNSPFDVKENDEHACF